MNPQRIAHVDMDAFYASVELLRKPELRGQPLVIGGRQVIARRHGEPARLRDYAGRGVITTCTYEARAFGIHSGMGLMKAAALCPDAILLPVDFDEYRRVSRLFKAALLGIAPVMEDRGIDEVFLDLGGLDPDTRALAQSLKDAVREATGLTCSIGVAPNKLLAKICSDLDKPDGLTLLQESDIPARIWPLEARRINGIGPKSWARLEQAGIRTIGELAACEPEWLIGQFGKRHGAWLHDAAHGRDARLLVTSREPKSLSRETTFERDLHPVHDRAALTPILVALCERVAADLKRKGYAARSIGIKLRRDDFSIVTRDHRLEQPAQAAEQILEGARACLKKLSAQQQLRQKLRLLGVRASGLLDTVAVAEAGAQHFASARAAEPMNGTLPLFEELQVPRAAP